MKTGPPSSGPRPYPSLRSEFLTLYGCRRSGPLLNLEDARGMLVAAAHAAGLTVLEDGARFHKFRSRGRGLTAFVLLSQSHLAIHTWPEAGMVAVDFLSYQDRPFEPAIAVLERALRPSYVARQGVGGLSFTERYGTHSALCIDATRVLASENSGLQRIHLFESPTFGRVLALDGSMTENPTSR